MTDDIIITSAAFFGGMGVNDKRLAHRREPCPLDAFSPRLFPRRRNYHMELSFQPQVPTHGPSDAFVVKAHEAGAIVKYRVHCDPNATLADLRDTLQNEEDNMMSADDRFHQGDFRIGKSSEPHIKWRDILHVRCTLDICASLLEV